MGAEYTWTSNLTPAEALENIQEIVKYRELPHDRAFYKIEENNRLREDMRWIIKIDGVADNSTDCISFKMHRTCRARNQWPFGRSTFVFQYPTLYCSIWAKDQGCEVRGSTKLAAQNYSAIIGMILMLMFGIDATRANSFSSPWAYWVGFLLIGWPYFTTYLICSKQWPQLDIVDRALNTNRNVVKS